MKDTNTQNLPAGYILLNGVSIHISELRQHTSDVERFQRHLPLMADLTDKPPGSPAAKAVFSQVDNPLEFMQSLREYGDLLLAKSGELK